MSEVIEELLSYSLISLKEITTNKRKRSSSSSSSSSSTTSTFPAVCGVTYYRPDLSIIRNGLSSEQTTWSIKNVHGGLMLINVDVVRENHIYFRMKTDKERNDKNWGPAEDITYNIQIKQQDLIVLKAKDIVMRKYVQPLGGVAEARKGGQRAWRAFGEWNGAVVAHAIPRIVKLRAYQETALQNIFSKWPNLTNSTAGPLSTTALPNLLLSLPTGAGKSLVIAKFIERCWAQRRDLRILLIVKQKNLSKQLSSEILHDIHTTGAIVVQLHENQWPYLQEVVLHVATIDTLVARVSQTNFKDKHDYIANLVDDRSKCPPADIVIVDEAHNIVASNFLKLIKAYTENYKAQVVGLTATPFRTLQKDHTELLQFFHDGLICGPTVGELMKNNFLTRIEIFSSKQRLKRGHCANEAVVLALYDKHCTKRVNVGKQGVIVFCNTKKLGNDVTVAMKQHGIKAAYVGSDIEVDVRNDLIEQYSNGEIDVLCTAQMLTEGFDAPRTGCVILNCRHVNSLVQYIQRVGRALRLYDNKETCLLLDIGGNSWPGSGKINFSIFDEHERQTKDELNSFPGIDTLWGHVEPFCDEIQDRIQDMNMNPMDSTNVFAGSDDELDVEQQDMNLQGLSEAHNVYSDDELDVEQQQQRMDLLGFEMGGSYSDDALDFDDIDNGEFFQQHKRHKPTDDGTNQKEEATTTTSRFSPTLSLDDLLESDMFDIDGDEKTLTTTTTSTSSNSNKRSHEEPDSDDQEKKSRKH